MGKGVVDKLARYIQHRQPNLRGFTRPNLFRMRQFYEAYKNHEEKLSALLTQLPWTHHLLILSRCKRPEEREFHQARRAGEVVQPRARTAARGRPLRARSAEPAESLGSAETIAPGCQRGFPRRLHPGFSEPARGHLEADLHKSLLANLRRFLAELGHDFCFIGSEVPLQVGGGDFALDLLFYHRGLCCLVAVELKIGQFEPEHLGKLNFYLEALDRDIKKPHEGPTIGVLLCAGKDSEVVEYALSRSLSPALVAEYQTRLPDKKLLEAKLHEVLRAHREGGGGVSPKEG